jgi:hypothetical protein
VGNTRKIFIKPLTEALISGCLTKHETLRFRGRFQFAARDVFGRVAMLTVLDCFSKLDDRAVTALMLRKKLLELGHVSSGLPAMMRGSKNSLANERLLEQVHCSLTPRANN